MSFALMFLSLPLFGNSVVGTALDDFHAPSEEGYYYFQPEDVGSQAFHNPVQIFIEGGFGALYNRKLTPSTGVRVSTTSTRPC